MPKKYLIYGATGGIGSATARLLAARGHQLHLVGRNPDALGLIAAELNATYSTGDVLDETFLQRSVAEAGESIDGLIYAVGSITLKALPRLSRADFIRDYELNAVSAALSVQAALPALKKSGHGAVLFFSSIAATQGFGMHASIAMAKGAISSLTLSLAAELAPHIRVNAIAPSLTQTPLSKSLWQNDTMAQSIASLHPIPRLGHVQDLASLAAFLVSEEASWITGQIIGVDGGRSTLRVKG